ncbi:Gfo/Idh/MocA family oxidoreductase [Shinella zoogloeoides]|uniref:Gfo/Idh/MocA family protein n=1 Tax=Shinella zoogloeoides TaxID=352475 RepID=UPI00299D0D16|nr:Gfo/Idh/MocA family oxidoreductase [Shinella zoogloeoides]WPE22966.1 Glucose--fructose oxidoreductase [Shinella zoogloeoides]
MRTLKLGMVGGGNGAFFGAAHRAAAAMTGRFSMVAGALSSDPVRARESGHDLGLAPERCYDDFETMAKREATDGGIDLVAVVTPNHLHAPACHAFLDAGVNILCDKPLTATLDEALALRTAAADSASLFGVAYTNAGFDMVREARAMVAAGEIGTVRVVRVVFPQEWLATAAEATGNKQAEWRTDPARSGAGSLGDIGTHAFHLAEFITGLSATALSAEVDTFVTGRRVDDNVTAKLRFDGGAKGLLWASQVAIGETNGLRIDVHGDKGSLGWTVEAANQLAFAPLGGRRMVIDRASHGTAFKGTMPPGHPQGFIEALARLYLDMADQIDARRDGRAPAADALLLPGIRDGVRGLRFVDAALRSGAEDGRWTDI